MNMLRTRIAAHVKSIRHSALQSPVQMQSASNSRILDEQRGANLKGLTTGNGMRWI